MLASPTDSKRGSGSTDYAGLVSCLSGKVDVEELAHSADELRKLMKPIIVPDGDDGNPTLCF